MSRGCITPRTPVGTVALFGMAISPALLSLIFPLGFRMTCYYYRKAYYRSFWQSPPACAVAEPHSKYTGETKAPLIVQNGHRYFFYAGLVFNVILSIIQEYWLSVMRKANGHVGVGTLVLLTECHSALALFRLMPHMPPHNRRTIEALLQTPAFGTSELVDLGFQFLITSTPISHGSHFSVLPLLMFTCDFSSRFDHELLLLLIGDGEPEDD